MLELEVPRLRKKDEANTCFLDNRCRPAPAQVQVCCWNRYLTLLPSIGFPPFVLVDQRLLGCGYDGSSV